LRRHGSAGAPVKGSPFAPRGGARAAAPASRGICDGFRPSDGAESRLMSPVLKLLLEGSTLSPAQMAEVLHLTEEEVLRELESLKRQRVLLGFRPVINLALEDAELVRAVIEVRITPERGGGFNRLAERISRFEEVEACYLMSGAYDLLVFVRGPTLQKVAAFVSEKLSTLEGVLSTATHFMLRSYKEHGFLLETGERENDRLKVSP
jgi:DNA-binding Lrp family transcriptional regulator